MSKTATIVLRATQAVATAVELGLTIYVTYLSFEPQQQCFYSTLGRVASCDETSVDPLGGVGIFLLFKDVWTILTLAVLLLVPLCLNVNYGFVVLLDGLAMLMWLAGAIALAVLATGYDATLNALTALAFVIWALFVATFTLNMVVLFRRRRTVAAEKHASDISYLPQAYEPRGFSGFLDEYRTPPSNMAFV